MLPDSVVNELAEQIIILPRKARRQAIREIADKFNIRENSVYRKLKVFSALNSDRKQRTDSDKPKNEQLLGWVYLIAGLKNAKISQKGMTMSTDQAILELTQSGQIPEGGITRATADRWIRKLELDKRKNHKKAAQRLVASYSNEFQMADFTVSQVFYLKTFAKQGFKIASRKSGFEKYYDEKKEEGNKKLWIFALRDKHSGLLWARYLEAQGEDTVMTLSMLYEAWRTKEVEFSGIPLQGLPHILYTDRSSAFMSKSAQTLFKGLGIEHKTHLPSEHKYDERARAKGGIERAFQDIARFEIALNARLERFSGIEIDLNFLNKAIDEWLKDYNNREIKDSQGTSCRLKKWFEGLPMEHPKCPEQEIFFRLAASGEMRTINNYLEIVVDNQNYLLSSFMDASAINTQVEVWRLGKDREILIKTTEGQFFGPIQPNIRETNAGEGEYKMFKESASEKEQKKAAEHYREYKEKIKEEAAKYKDTEMPLILVPKGEEVQVDRSFGSKVNPINPDQFASREKCQKFIKQEMCKAFLCVYPALPEPLKQFCRDLSDDWERLTKEEINNIIDKILKEAEEKYV